MNLRSFAVVTLTAVAAAQGPSSPAGLGAVEGNSGLAPFAPGAARRFQQLDATHMGSALLIGGLGLRRDATSVGVPQSDATTTFSVELGSCAMAVPRYEFDANYLSGRRSVVAAPRPISLPVWTTPGPVPGAFDLVLPFDRPFAYDGTAGLVIDITNLGDGLCKAPWCDAERIPPTSAPGTPTGAGCTVSGHALPFRHATVMENDGPGNPNFSMRLRVTVHDGPAALPTVLNMDLADPALAVSGLCAVLRATPLHPTTLPPSDLAGTMPGFVMNCPHMPVLVGLPLYTQVAAFDAGQPGLPIVLSNGLRTVMPGNAAPIGHECAYHVADFTSADAPLVFGGGLVIRLMP